MIGLLGAHRTGKSTLCQAILQVSRGNFWEVPVSISQMQKDMGYNSSNQSYDWETRKLIQLGLLHQFTLLLENSKHRKGVPRTQQMRVEISERTPLDLIGYLLLNAPDEPTQEDLEWINNYKAQCISLTNAFYEKVFLLQPGIPYVECDTSAKEDSMDKLNAFYLHTLLDPRLIIDRHIIDSNMTNLNDRVTEIITNL